MRLQIFILMVTVSCLIAFALIIREGDKYADACYARGGHLSKMQGLCITDDGRMIE